MHGRQVQSRFQSLRSVTIERCWKDNSCFHEVDDLRLVLDVAEIVINIERQVTAKLLLKTKVYLRFVTGTNRSKRVATFFTGRAKDTRSGRRRKQKIFQRRRFHKSIEGGAQNRFRSRYVVGDSQPGAEEVFRHQEMIAIESSAQIKCQMVAGGDVILEIDRAFGATALVVKEEGALEGELLGRCGEVWLFFQQSAKVGNRKGNRFSDVEAAEFESRLYRVVIAIKRQRANCA